LAASGERAERLRPIKGTPPSLINVPSGCPFHPRCTYAQLNGGTLTDEIKTAIGARITTAQSDPELIARAQEVREQIEREAKARQAAIAGLFGAVALSGEVEGKPPTRRGRGAGADQ